MRDVSPRRGARLANYIVKRLLFAGFVLVIISLVVFSGTRLVPGRLCFVIVGSQDADEATCQAIERSLGLDKPIYEQYFTYMGNVLRGDLGRSVRNNRPIVDEVKDRIPLTIELTLLSTGFALLLAIPIGVISAVEQDRWGDYLLRLTTIGWLSIPGFWIGTMLIVFPAKWWGYSPPVPYVPFWEDPFTNLEQMYLPAFSLGLALSASLARVTRSSMLEVLRQDYIRTARAKGLRERAVVLRHALQNAFIPVITLFGIQFGVLFGGTVVLEQIYALPGLGQFVYSSVFQKDYPAVQGVVLLFATFLILINLLVDLSYGWFDPRIRYA